MLDSERIGIENKRFIHEIKSLLNLPDTKQNTSLKDLYTFDISKKIFDLMASGFTIDVDPNVSEETGLWGIFRHLNVVHSRKDDADFLVVEGFKPEIGNSFDEPFTYICGIYRDLSNTVKINYFIEKTGLSSKSYAVMVSLNDEEVAEELEEDNVFLTQCASKLLNDFKDSVIDFDSTAEAFDNKFPSLHREWLSEAKNIDSNPFML